MKLHNDTPFVASLFRAQLHYRDLMMATVVLKASFEVSSDGSIAPVEDQLAITEGDADTALGIFPNDAVPIKQGCDFAVFGPAVSQTPVRVMNVDVRVGSFVRSLRVIGDRCWLESAGDVVSSQPIPFTSMPLDYSRAFGGNALQAEVIETPYAQNAHGKGWVVSRERAAGTHLPNLEELDQLLTAWQQQPMPAGMTPLPCTSTLRGPRGVVADLENRRTSLEPVFFNWAHPRMLLAQYPAQSMATVRGLTIEPQWQVRLPQFDVAAQLGLGNETYLFRLIPDTLALVPAWRRFWIVARRAFVYQFLPERMRSVRIEMKSVEDSNAATTIAAEMVSRNPRVPIRPPSPPEEFPIPWDMVREMYPLTAIVENLPLFASG